MIIARSRDVLAKSARYLLVVWGCPSAYSLCRSLRTDGFREFGLPAAIHTDNGMPFASPKVGDRLWLVTFMHYDLGYFDDEAGRVEPIADPFGSKVLPMCSE